MARPEIEIDATLVEKLASIQCSKSEIAAIVGCSVDTLDRRFAEQMHKGREHGKMSLRRRQFDVANKGNATMLIWLGKQWLSQRDKTSAELSGPDGKPVEVSNASALTDAQLEARYLTLLEKAKSNGG